MGTYNASAFNDNHTLLQLILNIKDYLVHNPNAGVYYTLGFQGEVGTTSIPKDKVYGPAGSDNKPSVGDIILYALDIGQGFFQVSGVNNVNYLGEYIGQTIQGPKGDQGDRGPEGPKGDKGDPGVKVYYTTGFQGEVGTTSIPKDKVHGPEGSTATPIIGDIILYALDIGQGFFQVSGSDANNYTGEIIGQTIQGPQGDKGDPGVGLNQLTGMSFVHQTATGVTYANGVATFAGQFKLTLSDGTNIFARGNIEIPMVAGAGIIIEASEDSSSLIIKAAPSIYTITGEYTHCENSNPATTADVGTAYAATITANSGYNFGDGHTLIVTMGDTDITSEVAVVSTDTISINIPIVTGDIDIYCIAVEIPTTKTLEESTWAEIAQVSADKSWDAMGWKVGDSKTITLNGTVGTLALDNYQCKVYIIGFDHNAEKEGQGISFGMLEGMDGKQLCLVDQYFKSGTSEVMAFSMNTTQTNAGGWKAAKMRKTILGSTDVENGDATPETISNPAANTLMAALPADLRSFLKPITKYTDNVGHSSDASAISPTIDYLPLMAEYEVRGAQSNANPNETGHQEQYEYYKSGNSTIKYKQNDVASQAQWWLRSPKSSSSTDFCNVLNSGMVYGMHATFSLGVAPVFLV